jgi:hypothetical protein
MSDLIRPLLRGERDEIIIAAERHFYCAKNFRKLSLALNSIKRLFFWQVESCENAEKEMRRKVE